VRMEFSIISKISHGTFGFIWGCSSLLSNIKLQKLSNLCSSDFKWCSLRTLPGFFFTKEIAAFKSAELPGNMLKLSIAFDTG
jgi:hypothetical protein